MQPLFSECAGGLGATPAALRTAGVGVFIARPRRGLEHAYPAGSNAASAASKGLRHNEHA